MKRQAKANWEGTLKDGKGTMHFSNYAGPYTFASRFEEGKGTNPEELVGAAISGCYSMFLAALMSKEDLKPKSVETNATVILDKDDTGPCIKNIILDTRAICEGLSQKKFDELVATAKKNCPISRLYQGGTATIEVKATLS